MTLKCQKWRDLTTSNYNKLSSDILHAKIKQKELVSKSDISNLVKISDLNTKLPTLATKADLKAEQDKIVQLQAFDSSIFHVKNVFGDMFTYQPTFNTLELKKTRELIMYSLEINRSI